MIYWRPEQSGLFYLLNKLFIYGLMYYEGFALQNNNNITPIKINLGVARKEAMNERFQHRHGHIKVVVGRRNLSKFGSAVKEIMKAIFNGRRIPVNIIGTRNEVNSFIEALKQEKQYFKTIFRDFGIYCLGGISGFI